MVHLKAQGEATPPQPINHQHPSPLVEKKTLKGEDLLFGEHILSPKSRRPRPMKQTGFALVTFERFREGSLWHLGEAYKSFNSSIYAFSLFITYSVKEYGSYIDV